MILQQAVAAPHGLHPICAGDTGTREEESDFQRPNHEHSDPRALRRMITTIKFP